MPVPVEAAPAESAPSPQLAISPFPPISAPAPKAFPVADSSPAAAPVDKGVGLWPSGEPARLGANINDALAVGDWNTVVLTSELLIQFAAKQWAVANDEPTDGDSTPTFLLANGAPAGRYASFRSTVRLAKTGREVPRADAMSALVLVLHVLW